MIDQTLARRYWPQQNPVGQQIKFGFGAGLQGLTIVGVAGDVKSDGFEAPNVPHIYVRSANSRRSKRGAFFYAARATCNISAKPSAKK